MCFSVEHEILPNEARPANEDVCLYIEKQNWGFANAALNSENETLSVVFVYAGYGTLWILLVTHAHGESYGTLRNLREP